MKAIVAIVVALAFILPTSATFANEENISEGNKGSLGLSGPVFAWGDDHYR